MLLQSQAFGRGTGLTPDPQGLGTAVEGHVLSASTAVLPQTIDRPGTDWNSGR